MLINNYSRDDFAVLGVPCNEFGLQNPGTNNETVPTFEYVRPGNGYKVIMDMSVITDVNGITEDPLFTFLKATCPGPLNTIGDPTTFYWTPIKQTDVSWNFEKYLIDGAGKPVKRYSPSTEPLELMTDIDAVINNNSGTPRVSL